VVTASYDPVFRPCWEKPGMTLGMGMTEKQGGTDVRANITTATPSGDFYTIVGHKWFLSAPMCDAFLVLARAPGGLSCFSSHASGPTARSMPFACSGSRTSSAIAPVRRARSSSPARSV
jgi:alkylation response protein AidB-like acyl-CoA dehydrogenase